MTSGFSPRSVQATIGGIAREVEAILASPPGQRDELLGALLARLRRVEGAMQAAVEVVEEVQRAARGS